MKNFDNKGLGADEVAFNIVTNRSIGAERFTSFLDSLLFLSGTGALPAFNLEIEELSKGSLFGRLRVVLLEPPEPSQIDNLERELGRLQERLNIFETDTIDLLRRQTEATENAAASAKVQANAATIAASYLPITTALTALTLIATVASCAADPNPNRCSLALAEMMERDDVAAVQFWSKDCSYTATKQNVPEFKRRDWIALAAEEQNRTYLETRTWMGPDGVLRSEAVQSKSGSGPLGSSPLGGEPLGGGTTPVALSEPYQQRPGDMIPMARSKSEARIPMGPTEGTIRFEGSLVLFQPISDNDPRQAMIMSPAPQQQFIRSNNIYLVRGTILRTGDRRDILMPELITVKEIGNN